MEDDFEARMAAIRSGLKQEVEDRNKQKSEDRKNRSREDTESLRDQFGYSGIMGYLHGRPIMMPKSSMLYGGISPLVVSFEAYEERWVSWEAEIRKTPHLQFIKGVFLEEYSMIKHLPKFNHGKLRKEKWTDQVWVNDETHSVRQESMIPGKPKRDRSAIKAKRKQKT